jgi:hypothetical protein
MDNSTKLSIDPPAERLAEVSGLLGEGLLRLERRKSSRFPGLLRESSLHILPDQSGGVPPYSPEASHD